MSLEKFKSSADPAAKGVGKWEMGKGESGNWGCGSEQGISAATSLAKMQQCNNGQTNNARCEKCGTLRMFNKQTNSLTNVRNCNGNNSAVNNV